MGSAKIQTTHTAEKKRQAAETVKALVEKQAKQQAVPAAASSKAAKAVKVTTVLTKYVDSTPEGS